MSITLQACPPSDPFRLTAADRETMRCLDQLAGRYLEIYHSTKTIANRLGVTIRAAQLRLQRLMSAGKVARVLDYGKRSRRRLLLLWKDSRTYVDSVGAELCAHSAQDSAPTDPPPLLLGVIEKIEERMEFASGENPPPQNLTQVDPTPEPEETPEPPGRITDEQKQRLKTAVKAVAAPGDLFFRSTVSQAVKTAGYRRVAASLHDMAEVKRREPIRNVRGLFHTILREYQAVKVEPPDPFEVAAAEEKAEAERLARFVAYMEAAYTP